MSQDVLLVESVDQAAVMMKPLRIALLRAMTRPRSCSDLARVFDETPQKIYYHVKAMERAGLVERSGERLVNGIPEGFYQACAQSYWLSPRLVRSLGGRQVVQDQTSLRMLVGHAEEMLEDVARLAERSGSGEHIPSLSLGVEIELPVGERRARFLDELRTTFEALARRYTTAPEASDSSAASTPSTFRFTLACYPKAVQEVA